MSVVINAGNNCLTSLLKIKLLYPSFQIMLIMLNMKFTKLVVISFFTLSTISMQAPAQTFHANNLEVVAEFGKSQPIGVSVSSTNRLFVSFPKREPYVFGLTEIVEGKRVAYPNKEWNRKNGQEENTFVNVQDIYIDTKDQLWVLDSKPSSKNSVFGKSGSNEANIGKFKLIQIDLLSNQVKQIYQFEDLAKDKSGLNDVRVDTERQLAYLSDPGQAAIVVLDLRTGKTRLALQNQPMTLAVPNFSLSYEGHEMADKEGNIFKSNINGVALTKDNKYFYFRPINGLNLYRIETKYLADTNLNDLTLAKFVENLGETVVCHGMVADASGNIYLTSSTDYSIKYFTPEQQLTTLIQDKRLIWPDSMGIGSDGYLYVSSAQVNRLPQWNNGVDKTSFPYRVYRVKIKQ